MDRSNWARRADVLLRAHHPNLLTRIFETLPDTFVIVLDPKQQKAEELNVDEIRFITLHLSLSNEIPGSYVRELTPIPDSEMVQDFSGFPYTRSELFNLISSKFSHLPIIGMREGKYPDGTNVIEVSTQLLSEQQKTLLDFCNNLGSIVPFSVEVSNNSESAPDSYSDVLEIRSSRVRPNLPPFVRADEDFWFDNIDQIANGKLALHRITGLLDDQSRCFIDATMGSQINLRQALMTFDTIYISPPLADKYSEFLETQALTEEDLLLLVEVGRLRGCLKMVVAARRGLIQAWDVDPREPRPDGRHRPQDQAVSD